MSTLMELKKIIGVDGYSGGWLAIDGQGTPMVFKTINELWRKYHDASRIMIDIPIGLKENGPSERFCDKFARKILKKPRSSSVFRVPSRPAVYADIKEASAINQRYTGKKLSKQALGIIAKIREVDSLLLNNKKAQLILHEVHPELCFYNIAGRTPMRYSKKKKKGVEERRALLQNHFFNLDKLITEARSLDWPLVKIDDVLDALSALVIGMKNELNFIPENGEEDSKGLQMRMYVTSF